ncbi:Ribonuclease P protein component [Buchnera aphidicola (Phyllaphis fagi)]
MKKNNRLLFSKKLRLLKSHSFNYVFKKPIKTEYCEITILSRYNHFNFPRLGIIVSKKVSKYSYKRNKIKRIIRESFRLVQHHLLSLDFILIVKKNILIIKTKNLKKKIKYLWIRHYQYI